LSYIETQFHKNVKLFRYENTKELAFIDLFSKKVSFINILMLNDFNKMV